MTWEIHQGHTMNILKSMPEKSVQVVCTSPPYWALRSYGTDPQVWGGDPDCEHNWDTTQLPMKTGGKTAKQLTNKGSQAANRIHHEGYKDAFRNNTMYQDNQLMPTNSGSVCIKCGAWRGELGSEPDPYMFVEHMVEVFRAVKRVLRDDGICWINITDSYSGGGRGDSTSKIQNARERQGFVGSKLYRGIPAKNMCLVPERLLIALQDDGWVVRSKIRLIKVSAMPESVDDRPSNATEELFMLTKSGKYFYDQDAVRQEHARLWDANKIGGSLGANTGWHEGAHGTQRWDGERSPNPLGANLKNWWVWTPEHNTVEFCTGCNGYFEGALDKRRIRSKKFTLADDVQCDRCDKIGTHTANVCPDCGEHGKWLAHYAAFPTWLPQRCIEASTSLYGACARCGAPWERVTETSYKSHGKSAKSQHRTVDGERSSGDNIKGMFRPQEMPHGRASKITDTLGWTATCKCDTDEVVPCKVLDPFSGTGTTALVADRLGRHGIGVELNSGYFEYSKKRLQSDAPLVAAVEEQEKIVQVGLFEETF